MKGTKKSTWKLKWYSLSFMEVFLNKNIHYICEHRVKMAPHLLDCQNVSVKFPCVLFCVFHLETSSFYQKDVSLFIPIYVLFMLWYFSFLCGLFSDNETHWVSLSVMIQYEYEYLSISCTFSLSVRSLSDSISPLWEFASRIVSVIISRAELALSCFSASCCSCTAACDFKASTTSCASVSLETPACKNHHIHKTIHILREKIFSVLDLVC